MNPYRAVEANENTMVDAHVIWALPAAVKTVIVMVVSHKLLEYLLLQSQRSIIIYRRKCIG
jgi:hypothetical protein